MKRFFIIFLLSIISFTLLTIKSARIESHFDGNDTYGFPLTFYTKFSSMCVDCPGPKYEIHYLNLVADFAVAVLVGIATWRIILIFMKQLKNKGNNR